MTELVRVIVDPDVPPGEIHFGGARVLPGPVDDETLGRELRTREVRVPTEKLAEEMRDVVRNHSRAELTE